MGNDPRYSKTRTFDPFPFPAFDELDPALVGKLRDLGEHLDAFRKERLAEHDFLTMTGLYNVLERLRELENGCAVPPLSDAEKDIHAAGLVSVLKEIHDEIDAAVFQAYGWDDLIPRLVGKPGATTPSPHKSDDQEAAEEELLARLVALNQQRVQEEKQGQVRWLRPDYQLPKLGHKIAGAKTGELDVDTEQVGIADAPKWPSDGLEQIRVLRDLLAAAGQPLSADQISAALDGRASAKRKARVAQVLETLAATGAARANTATPQTTYFLAR